MKIALVYDRVNTPHGGAEKVLLALHQIFPDAPLYTSVYDPKQAPWAKVFQVKTSFLQYLPGARQHHRWLAWLMPLAFESFDFSEFEIVISIASAEAKGIITNTHQLHLCYLLTPTRYLYSHHNHYQTHHSVMGWPIIKYLTRKLSAYLRWWDQAAATRPDLIIPISKLVATRTQQYYHRTTQPVIYPPVEVKPTTTASVTSSSNSSKKFPILDFNLPEKYYLVVARLVSYKKIDLAIKACQQLNKNLIIVGEGPERSYLQSLITRPEKIQLLGSVNQPTLTHLYQHCRALILPGTEDFGITVLEALAHGTPVILQAKSGGAEIIQNNIHGLYLESESIPAVISAIQKREKTTFDPSKLKKVTQKLSTKHFQEQWQRVIVQIYSHYFEK